MLLLSHTAPLYIWQWVHSVHSVTQTTALPSYVSQAGEQQGWHASAGRDTGARGHWAAETKRRADQPGARGPGLQRRDGHPQVRAALLFLQNPTWAKLNLLWKTVQALSQANLRLYSAKLQKVTLGGRHITWTLRVCVFCFVAFQQSIWDCVISLREDSIH